MGLEDLSIMKAARGEPLTQREKLKAVGQGLVGIIGLAAGLGYRPKEAYSDAAVNKTPDYERLAKEMEKLNQDGKHQQVIDSYAAFATEENRSALFFNELGGAYSRLGSLDNAIIYFQKATEYNPNDPIYWKNIGLSYKLKGDIPNAINNLKIYVSLLPDSNIKKKQYRDWINKNK